MTGATTFRVPPLACVQLFTGMALFGATTPISRIIAADLPVFSSSMLRMLLAVLALSCFLGDDLRALRRATVRDWYAIAGITAFGMVGFTAMMLFGMRLTTGVVGATVMSATPAVTAVAAVLFFGEAFNRRKALALALSVAGALAISYSRQHGAGGDAIVTGALLVGIAVCFEAAYTLLSKVVAAEISSLAITYVASLAAIPCFAVLAVLFDAQPFDYTRADAATWMAVLFWGIGAAALAPVLWYRGVRSVPGTLSAGFMAVMPISGLVLSYVLLDESFRVVHLLGFGLAFLGVLLMVREHASDS